MTNDSYIVKMILKKPVVNCSRMMVTDDAFIPYLQLFSMDTNTEHYFRKLDYKYLLFFIAYLI